ncbi:uncharacterized protein LOC143036414 [Oratosquilla oratoria]|uniref:uncharacterized protein LOC143036414 n=1 Tax=Oratosquilla oratoria TaxID=337810 RepID=UPI003F76CCB1
MSEPTVLENGTPQGGVLSPTLFNVLISNVLKLPLPHGCKIISYADDLALIIAGKQRCHDRAQRCLDAVAAECVRIGLKISPRKSKAMAFGLGRGKEPLVAQGFALDWVTQFQYLGVWLDRGLTFNREISYLRERMTARTTVMRAMCGRALGATHQVLRTYYVQAVRSIADYAAPALLTVDVDKLQRLETCQNEAARVILGAQRWYKTHCNAPNTWLSHAAKLLDSFQLRQPLLEKGIPQSHPDFKCPPPWAPAPVTFKFTTLPGTKGACHPDKARVLANNGIRALTRPGHTVYFTDGSVEQRSPNTAGAAFVTDGHIFGRRVSDSASSLQAEAVAMQGALEHALVSHSNSVVIHTDSLSLISCLQQTEPDDNVHLLTNIIALLHKLHLEGRHIIINWVPSHVGVHGNDLADAAAATARKRASVDVQVPPSKSQLQLKTRALARKKWHLQHRQEAQISQRAGWYIKVTAYEPLVLPRSTPRRIASISDVIQQARPSWVLNSGPSERDSQRPSFALPRTPFRGDGSRF